MNSGANPNIQTETAGDTALHMAAQKGLEKVTRLLLDGGADARLKNRTGWTALHCAVLANDPEAGRIVQRMLLKAGITALHFDLCCHRPFG